MNSGLGSLHKVLKDETRSRIVLLLNEKGSLNYMDLMKDLGVKSTGQMNYHLKVLGDLITKTGDGQYTLAEKGKLACRFLVEFPQENSQRLGMKPRWWRIFWITQAIFIAVSLVINLEMYFYGYIDLTRLYYRSTFFIIGSIGITYMLMHIFRDVLSEKGRAKLNKILYIIIGAFTLRLVFWLVQLKMMQIIGIYSQIDYTFAGDAYALISLLAYYIIGAFIGNWIGKKRAYYLPQWPA